jgi:threonine/homoserine/homoserine lactone efflux protein
MPDTAALAAFLGVSLTLMILPGPAVLYIVARGIHQGRPAGLVSALGIEAGTLIHVALATLGVSAMLASSPGAFTALKSLGVGYLVYLGGRTFLERAEVANSDGDAARSLGRLFAHGVVVELLNPKTALFFIAFLPQFVDPARGSVERQMLLLGAVFIALAIVVDGAYALLAGTLGDWLSGRSRFEMTQRYFSGCAYMTLALSMALGGLSL